MDTPRATKESPHNLRRRPRHVEQRGGGQCLLADSRSFVRYLQFFAPNGVPEFDAQRMQPRPQGDPGALLDRAVKSVVVHDFTITDEDFAAVVRSGVEGIHAVHGHFDESLKAQPNASLAVRGASVIWSTTVVFFDFRSANTGNFCQTPSYESQISPGLRSSTATAGIGCESTLV